MTPFLWFMVGAIIVKLALTIPLFLSIRESRASIKRCNAIINAPAQEE